MLFCPKRVISQHLEAWGSSKLAFPDNLRAICSAVSRDFKQPPQAVYLYIEFHKNWLQTNGFSSKITSPSLKSLLAKSPFPFCWFICLMETLFKEKWTSLLFVSAAAMMVFYEWARESKFISGILVRGYQVFGGNFARERQRQKFFWRDLFSFLII